MNHFQIEFKDNYFRFKIRIYSLEENSQEKEPDETESTRTRKNSCTPKKLISSSTNDKIYLYVTIFGNIYL